jgi:hypothetical protein
MISTACDGWPRFGDQQAAAAVPSLDRSGLVEERARVEHLEHFGVGGDDRCTAEERIGGQVGSTPSPPTLTPSS